MIPVVVAFFFWYLENHYRTDFNEIIDEVDIFFEEEENDFEGLVNEFNYVRRLLRKTTTDCQKFTYKHSPLNARSLESIKVNNQKIENYYLILDVKQGKNLGSNQEPASPQDVI